MACEPPPPEPQTCSDGQVYYSTQWWGVAFESGPFSKQVPQSDGTMGHIHVEFCVPGGPIDGTWNVTANIMLHKVAGGLSGSEVDVGLGPDGTSVENKPILFSCGPEPASCKASVNLQVPLANVPTGRREFRIRFLPANHDNGQRVFATNGAQVCVRSCTPTYRNEDVSTIGRGWNEETNYSIAEVREGQLSAPPRVSGVWAPRVSTSNATESFVHVDALFGKDNFGRVIHHSQGSFTGEVRIDTAPLKNGFHCLAVRSDTRTSIGTNVGIVQIPFVVENSSGSSPGLGGCGPGTSGV